MICSRPIPVAAVAGGLSPPRRAALLLLAASLPGVAEVARGQPATWPHRNQPFAAGSGLHHAPEGPGPTIAHSELVEVGGATWLRVHFADYDFGAASFVTITSLADDGRQRLDGWSMPIWLDSSAIFNGDALLIELHVAPGDSGVFFELDALTVGEPPDALPPESQCGPSDDRIGNLDNRIGRIAPIGCTGWLVSNGAYLSAGHCGPNFTTQVLEFNVPASTCNGTPVASDPDDQYPITSASFFDDGAGQIGNDWAVFGVGPNSNHGQRPVERYGGFFRTSRDNNPVDVRVTGFGSDNVPQGCGVPTFNNGRNSASSTEQTHVGGYLGETFQAASDVFIEYTVDTEGGNSGSPVIVRIGGATQNFAIGIHTNAGCNPPASGNTGTGFEHDTLENTIAAFPSGINEEYVDAGHPHAGALGDGSVHRPFDTVPEAVSTVASGGTIVIVAGGYPASAGNTFFAGTDGRAMTFLAPVGTVTIGN